MKYIKWIAAIVVIGILIGAGSYMYVKEEGFKAQLQE